MKKIAKELFTWLWVQLVTNFVAFGLILLILRALRIVGGSGKYIVMAAAVYSALLTFVEIMYFSVHLLSEYVRKKIRQWKVKRRIIRQAKAAGAWSIPIAGGKALELHAAAYGIKREPGETDVQLRARCMAAAGERDERRRRPWAK